MEKLSIEVYSQTFEVFQKVSVVPEMCDHPNCDQQVIKVWSFLYWFVWRKMPFPFVKF